VAFDIEEGSVGNRYLLTLYFVVATMMAVGFGDVHPITTEERILAMFTMLMGASFFGLIVANVSALLETMNARSFALQRRLDEVREYMMDRKLPLALQRRITQYYRYYYSQKSLFNESDVLNGLSKPLRNQVVKHSMNKVVRSMRLFKDEDPSVLAAVVTRMKPLLHLPLDVVAEEGSVGKEMFFLIKGAVDVIVEIPRRIIMASQRRNSLHNVDDVRKATMEEVRADPSIMLRNTRVSQTQAGSIHYGGVDAERRAPGASESCRETDSQRRTSKGKGKAGGGRVYIRNKMKSMKDLVEAQRLRELGQAVDLPSLLLGIYTTGHHFGDVGVLMNRRRPVGYRSSAVCNMQAISKRDLEILLFDFPELASRMKALAVTRYRAFMALKRRMFRRVLRKGVRRQSQHLPHVRNANDAAVRLMDPAGEKDDEEIGGRVEGEGGGDGRGDGDRDGGAGTGGNRERARGKTKDEHEEEEGGPGPGSAQQLPAGGRRQHNPKRNGEKPLRSSPGGAKPRRGAGSDNDEDEDEDDAEASDSVVRAASAKRRKAAVDRMAKVTANHLWRAPSGMMTG